jgi:hypothetical protein
MRLVISDSLTATEGLICTFKNGEAIPVTGHGGP